MALKPISDQDAGEIYQLDEHIVDRLSSRNSKQGISEGTKETYKAAVRDFNQFLARHALVVNEESLKLYFNEIRGRLKAATLNLRKYALLRCIKAQLGQDSVLTGMMIEKVFEQIPTYRTERAVPYDKCLPETEILALLEVAPTEKTALLIQFLFKSGCRISEGLGIRLTDCHPAGRNVRIQLLGKRNKTRNIKIPWQLYDAIRQAYQGETYLFESRSGKPLSRQNVLKQIKRTGRKLGLNISPHVMRHSRAMDMHINKGISLTATSRQLGHADVSTTAGMYIHTEVDYDELFDKDLV